MIYIYRERWYEDIMAIALEDVHIFLVGSV